ncbi:MAG: hypothetical protein HZB55_13210 [Deltaproteobacteria bacterium]|nr:hypothetical protein [Deltaproteobacteria bacterium]
MGTADTVGLLYHVVTVGSLVVFKLAVLVVGYLLAKLGHDLLIKGVSGEFKFKAEFQGTKADLISASPGIFFILMATILIAIGILKDKPFATRVTSTSTSLQSGGERPLEPRPPDGKPSLPPAPPKEGTP